MIYVLIQHLRKGMHVHLCGSDRASMAPHITDFSARYFTGPSNLGRIYSELEILDLARTISTSPVFTSEQLSRLTGGAS